MLWREWLSKTLINDYLEDRAYYILNPNDESETNVDNPDQRITDDTKAFTGQSLTFTLGIFDAFLTFALKEIPIAIAYSTWAGVGIFLITLFGYLLHGQSLQWQSIIGLIFIALGVGIVNTFKDQNIL